jgi:hypothetical protein
MRSSFSSDARKPRFASSSSDDAWSSVKRVYQSPTPQTPTFRGTPRPTAMTHVSLGMSRGTAGPTTTKNPANATTPTIPRLSRSIRRVETCGMAIRMGTAATTTWMARRSLPARPRPSVISQTPIAWATTACSTRSRPAST